MKRQSRAGMSRDSLGELYSRRFEPIPVEQMKLTVCRLESAQRTDPQAYFQGECIDTFEEPFIIFRFLYRSERTFFLPKLR